MNDHHDLPGGAVMEDYGPCCVCGDTMPAGSDPHWSEDDQAECHEECCPECQEDEA